MKKIILTESQIKRLKRNLNEYYDNSDQYETKCKVTCESYDLNYKGNEINYIDGGYDIRVLCNIEIEARSWGIKNIGIYNITGPTEYEIEVNYYLNDDGDSKTERVPIKLNWDNIEIEEERSGLICVGDEITLKLKNDESGNIVCGGITVPVYTL